MELLSSPGWSFRELCSHSCQTLSPDRRCASINSWIRLLHALLSSCRKFIAGKPTGQRELPRRLRPEHEAKSCDNCIACKIHVRAVFVVRLVIAVLREILGLLLAPRRGMADVFDPFIDRKRRHAHARQAEMIRTVIMSGLRAGIATDRQMKVPRGRLHQGIERGA